MVQARCHSAAMWIGSLSRSTRREGVVSAAAEVFSAAEVAPEYLCRSVPIGLAAGGRLRQMKGRINDRLPGLSGRVEAKRLEPSSLLTAR